MNCAKFCAVCFKQVPEYSNYCDFNCQIEQAKSLGAIEIRPNGLPIVCVGAGGLKEHEHADDPLYKFPVDVVYIGEVDIDQFTDYELIMGYGGSEEQIRAIQRESHAFLDIHESLNENEDIVKYVITLYECCSYMWKMSDGTAIGHNHYLPENYALSTESLEKIRSWDLHRVKST